MKFTLTATAETLEEAAHSFLYSSPSSIELVSGEYTKESIEMVQFFLLEFRGEILRLKYEYDSLYREYYHHKYGGLDYIRTNEGMNWDDFIENEKTIQFSYYNGSFDETSYNELPVEMLWNKRKVLDELQEMIAGQIQTNKNVVKAQKVMVDRAAKLNEFYALKAELFPNGENNG